MIQRSFGSNYRDLAKISLPGTYNEWVLGIGAAWSCILGASSHLASWQSKWNWDQPNLSHLHPLTTWNTWTSRYSARPSNGRLRHEILNQPALFIPSWDVASYQDQKSYLTSPLGGVVNGKYIIEGWLTAFEQAHGICAPMPRGGSLEQRRVSIWYRYIQMCIYIYTPHSARLFFQYTYTIQSTCGLLQCQGGDEEWGKHEKLGPLGHKSVVNRFQWWMVGVFDSFQGIYVNWIGCKRMYILYINNNAYNYIHVCIHVCVSVCVCDSTTSYGKSIFLSCMIRAILLTYCTVCLGLYSSQEGNIPTVTVYP